MSETGRTLTVATLNVHGWADARQADNVDRVAALVKVLFGAFHSK